ncbi:LppA family lipoprotein [Quadrisphaera sp. GCM10027208]|uniref:LppA family lipoprotein n=1 Tax=Quadrisphaera sp. GCM10027208 TaxID=3273423 RepID=UPI00361E28C9
MGPGLTRTMTAAATAAVLTLGACAMGTDEPTQDELAAELASRPSIEEATVAQDEMLTEIRAAIDTAIGPQNWRRKEVHSASGCRDFPGLDGMERDSDRWIIDGGVTDQEWDLVEQAVTTVTGEHGFHPPEVILDRPGDHVLMIFRDDGAIVDLGTELNLVLGASTGCHPRT